VSREYKFDAFISYRHAETDKFIAENLHKQLEAFRLPGSISKKRPGQKNKIERVFRDKEELPLTSNLEDPILEALNDSEWLIVICSPRLRQSLWCKKEIETFVKLRGRARVLAVLIEGEPADSFPDELLFKTETRTLPDGSTEELRIPVEPLAADVRGKTKKEMLKAMKTETLRLLAAMFQLNYDDLRQRHKEQRMRRIMTASLIGGAACLTFGVYSTATALRIQKQKEQIEIQSQAIKAQSEEIKAQSEEIQKQNDELSLRQARSLAELATGYLEAGNRADAISTAVEALTESGGIPMPYTPEAQYILTESIRAYDTGNTHKAEYQYETAGRVDSVTLSPDQDTLCIYDDTNTITLFDLVNREEIKILGSNEYGCSGDYGISFLGNDRFVYTGKEDIICVYDLNTKEIVGQITKPMITGIFTDKAGKYLVLENWSKNFDVYDSETLEHLGTTPKVETQIYTDGPYFSENDVLACAYSVGKDSEGSELYTLYFIDLKTMHTISTYEMGTRQPEDLVMKDGRAYLLSGMYAQYYSGADTYATAIDIATGEVIWEYKQPGYFSKALKHPYYEASEELLVVTGDNAVLVNLQSGEASATIALSSEPLTVYSYSNSDNFMIYTKAGENIVISGEKDSAFDMSHYFECKTQANEQILHSVNGIIVCARNDNKITVYTTATGPEVIKIDSALAVPEAAEEFIGSRAAETARSYGLDRPDFVRSLYYSENQKYCFIEYYDYDLAIYDVTAGRLCHTIEEAYPCLLCAGTDADGYTYLLGYYGCYVLNTEMKPIMFIDGARKVDYENRKVYLNWNNQYYEAPLYTPEELITMAKNYREQEK